MNAHLTPAPDWVLKSVFHLLMITVVSANVDFWGKTVKLISMSACQILAKIMASVRMAPAGTLAFALRDFLG